jgi:hypothetical protein
MFIGANVTLCLTPIANHVLIGQAIHLPRLLK